MWAACWGSPWRRVLSFSYERTLSLALRVTFRHGFFSSKSSRMARLNILLMTLISWLTLAEQYLVSQWWVWGNFFSRYSSTSPGVIWLALALPHAFFRFSQCCLILPIDFNRLTPENARNQSTNSLKRHSFLYSRPRCFRSVSPASSWPGRAPPTFWRSQLSRRHILSCRLWDPALGYGIYQGPECFPNRHVTGP